VPLTGTSPAIVVRAGGGNEGPWWWDGFCGSVSILGKNLDTVFVWTDGSASVTSGPGTLSAVVTGSDYILVFTADGTVVVTASTAGIVAHRPAEPIITTVC